MQITKTIEEARRQVEICNACRYCESFCSVFPAINRERHFSDGDITQLANLCHNCRGCYYACQYTEPHEFKVNIPKAMAEVRQESWQDYAVPAMAAKTFHKSGVLMALAVIAALAFILLLFQNAAPAAGEAQAAGFYGVLPHNAMIAVFIPAFFLPIISIAISLRRYWKSIGGERLRLAHFTNALGSVAKLKDLSGGQGEGCNFEDEDRFSNARRWSHQAIMYGFLLCFASTSVATIMHYFFNMPAPYPLFSLPKLLGITGGVILSLGTLSMASLKLRADKNLGDARVWGGEMGFVLLLFVVSTTGLALYMLGSTGAMPALLAIHLASVLAFFLLTPFSKMIHGFYRLASLLRDAQIKAKL
ncbi:tricarballylate utilization 4Fe-4S protein TcuB [Leucothrix pacifica]|uniref:Tricarballylate utilization 4Fe-4S protein TcuB n=1 Tax=Leucothrix pacifica TaxID=1247513 RepID=A0A317CH31_9GAMM|nr:tricarballylate utilization 4Fe-4S protein TcuB [Leucothrix pacifica]PWQ97669.1 tricarballylate utilization 4Fe-4S protein TcuB [Leucothrix pacifica]